MKTEKFKLPNKIGRHVEYEAHGKTYRVMKVKQGVYCLRDCGDGFAHLRVRWGNSEQIREDILYTQENGCLPPFSSHGIY